MTDDTEVTDDTTEDGIAEPTEQDYSVAEDTDENISLENARKLRAEAKTLRDRAKSAEARADELARELFTAKVAATGKLADPSDLDFDADLLETPDDLADAIETLIETKPHLKARKVAGDIGQGVHGKPAAPLDFSGLFH